jgi:1-deoxy-D-xylulose-5-phosphate reductoisomerase
LARFRCLDLAYQALRAGGTAPAILNAANEVAVAAFLDEKLPFLGIPGVIEHALEHISTMPVNRLEDVQEADSLARKVASDRILRQGADAFTPHASRLTPH